MWWWGGEERSTHKDWASKGRAPKMNQETHRPVSERTHTGDDVITSVEGKKRGRGTTDRGVGGLCLWPLLVWMECLSATVIWKTFNGHFSHAEAEGKKKKTHTHRQESYIRTEGRVTDTIFADSNRDRGTVKRVLHYRAKKESLFSKLDISK